MKHRETKEGMGFVYLMTNSMYEKESIYKYGITINPYERKRIQNNSVPSAFPFYDRILILSQQYKEIEKWLENKFKSNNYLIVGDKGGTEWIKADFNSILEIYKDAIKVYPNSKLCIHGKSYRYIKGELKEMKLPNCRLDLLGIKDDCIINFVEDNKPFKVKDNKIIIDNNTLMPLSSYMNIYHNRMSKTNEHNGYQYFTYRGKLIYDMWQNLLNLM